MVDNPISRRTFIQGGLSLAAVGAVGGVVAPPVLVGSARAAGAETLRAWSMAMHIHGCFSEGAGSMEAQLDQAATNGIDVIWWSEHEFRMTASGARRVLHLDGLSESEDGLAWTWTAASSGSLTEKSATFVTGPVSPADTAGSKALKLVGRSTSSAFATYRLNGSQYNTLHRTSLDGTTMLVDVNPTAVGPNGYLAVFLTTSHRPAGGGETAGSYTLEYRVGGDQAVGSRVRSGRNGIISLGAAAGCLDHAVDRPRCRHGRSLALGGRARRLLYTVAIGVGSRLGFRTEGHVDFLRFDRVRKSPSEVLDLQRELMGAYAPRFPSVTQHGALEWSMLNQHVNWYGGSLTLPPPTSPPWQKDTSTAAMLAATQRIHDAGGVASYNHPFGSGTGSASSQSAQDSARRGRATELIAARAYGCDILEVGYPVKGGVQIAGYLSLWDALSRNGIFVTGTGVSDDHSGQNWLTLSANFVTWAWAGSTESGALTQALAAGRVYWGNPAVFRGQLDLVVDGYVPMGAVSVEALTTRSLRVIATGLPSGSTVDVVTGVVDYAGSAFPTR